MACITLLGMGLAHAQTARDHAVELHANTLDGGRNIILDSVTANNATTRLAWKGQGSFDWNLLDISLSGPLVDLDALGLDRNVDLQCLTDRSDADGRMIPASGYITLRQIDASAPSARVAIVIDAEAAVELAPELQRFRDDLRREGWSTQVITVPPSRHHGGAPQVRQRIYQAYTAPHTSPLTHVILIGAIPIPYAGGFSVRGVYPPPDGHHNHGGAWAADVYYADMEIAPGIDVASAWTDTEVDIADTGNVFRTENANVPGDGKFDQSVIPSDVELAVGRVDLADLPTFGTSDADRRVEFTLLRRYLDKNHRYRTLGRSIPLRAVIDDNFQGFTYERDRSRIHEAFAASAWRSFSPIVADVTIGDWTPETSERASIDTMQCLLTYACGGGGFTHCSYVTTTKELAGQPLRSPFTLLFGSYFGDVAAQDNIMRAVIAAQGDALVCGWSGRPHWLLHPLAAGATIGECLVTTQSNAGTYRGSTIVSLDDGSTTPFRLGERGVHMQLVGDPTLRLPGPVLIDGTTRLIDAVGTTDIEFDVRTTDSAWVIAEFATSPDGPWTRLQQPFYLRTGERATNRITLPSSHGYLRLLPYVDAENRNGRTWTALQGRGVILPIGTTTVADTTIDATTSENVPDHAVYLDLLGRIVPSSNHLPAGVYLWKSSAASGVRIIR